MMVKKSIRSHMLSPLSGWIKRNHPIPERFYNGLFEDRPDTENWLAWLTIEESSMLHEVNKLEWISLKDSIKLTSDYLDKCSDLINGLDGGWLDGEEQIEIMEEIGEPPLPCLPIYLITVSDKQSEKLVYIGKTKSSSRFSGGHTAALKLHAPRYKNKKKTVYRCSIWFHFNDEYIVLDWLKPNALALNILDSFESQLIFEFQPELNIYKKKKRTSEFEFSIQIENIIDQGFLNNIFVYPK